MENRHYSPEEIKESFEKEEIIRLLVRPHSSVITTQVYFSKDSTVKPSHVRLVDLLNLKGVKPEDLRPVFEVFRDNGVLEEWLVIPDGCCEYSNELPYIPLHSDAYQELAKILGKPLHITQLVSDGGVGKFLSFRFIAYPGYGICRTNRIVCGLTDEELFEKFKTTPSIYLFEDEIVIYEERGSFSHTSVSWYQFFNSLSNLGKLGVKYWKNYLLPSSRRPKVFHDEARKLKPEKFKAVEKLIQGIAPDGVVVGDVLKSRN